MNRYTVCLKKIIWSWIFEKSLKFKTKNLSVPLIYLGGQFVWKSFFILYCLALAHFHLMKKSSGVGRKHSSQLLWQTPNRHPNIKYVVRTFFESFFWINFLNFLSENRPAWPHTRRPPKKFGIRGIFVLSAFNLNYD